MKRLPPPVLKVWPLKENPLGRLLSAGLGWIAGGWADMSWGILVQGMGWGVSFVVANQDHTGRTVSAKGVQSTEIPSRQQARALLSR